MKYQRIIGAILLLSSIVLISYFTSLGFVDIAGHVAYAFGQVLGWTSFIFFFLILTKLRKKISMLFVIGILWISSIITIPSKIYEPIEDLEKQFESLKDKGKYEDSINIAQKMLVISEREFGSNHTYTLKSLVILASLYKTISDYDKAEPLCQRALAISEKVLGPEHHDTAAILNLLAILYHDMGDYAEAEPLYQRALDILEKSRGAEHPETLNSLSNLGELYQEMGDYGKAEFLFLRALTISEKSRGAEHPDTETRLNRLALLFRKVGAYSKAEPLFQRALSISEKALGAEHPETATNLDNLAAIYWAEKKWPEAREAFLRSYQIQEVNIQKKLILLDEDEKNAYMQEYMYNGAVTFSLEAERYIKNSNALGLEVVLQRKGKVLEVLTDNIGRLRQHLTLKDQVLLEKIAALRSQEASLMFRGPDKLEPEIFQSELKKLDFKVKEFENKLSARNAEFSIKHQAVTNKMIQAALPKNSVLVEIVVYYPFIPNAVKQENTSGMPRYMVYVLHPSGEVKGIVLGEANELDALIDNWRKALSNPGDSSVRRGVKVANSDEKSSRTVDAGQQLYAKIIKPLLPLIGNTKTLFVAPDGKLNLVPLGALPNGKGHYLLETHKINYITSGRDMLKWSLPANTTKQPVVLANPDFGITGKQAKEPEILAANDRGRRSNEYTRGTFNFDPLSGTAEEATELSKLLTDGTVLTGAKATESALKAVHSPRILHLATHGFFLPDQPAEKPDAKTEMLSLDGQRPLPPSKNENPLLRSGIALAGANQLQSGNEDGVLTALEASGLDLWGTKLVVLSACETGIGKVSNGEGVYGLRRALVNAGAQSQVMSLWKVDDAATRDLMVDYYKRLLTGAGRAEALRQTQLSMLNSKDRNHPYYWAAFIASGDVRPIATVKH